MRSIELWHFQWPWRTPNWFSRSRNTWSRISEISYGQSYYSTI